MKREKMRLVIKKGIDQIEIIHTMYWQKIFNCFK